MPSQASEQPRASYSGADPALIRAAIEDATGVERHLARAIQRFAMIQAGRGQRLSPLARLRFELHAQLTGASLRLARAALTAFTAGMDTLALAIDADLSGNPPDDLSTEEFAARHAELIERRNASSERAQ